MKLFFIQLMTIVSLAFYNCDNSMSTSQGKLLTKDSLTPTQDTFQAVKLYESPDYIQSGFTFDSVMLEDRKTSSSFRAYYPSLLQNEHSLVDEWIKEVVNENVNGFKSELAEGSDSLLNQFVGTKLLYKDKKILSIVLSESSGAHDRNYYWDHRSFNYDMYKRKEIRMNDYFILKTREDTSFLNRFLDQCVGGGHDIDIRRFDDLSESFTFAVDSVNFYLFFGRYNTFVGFGDNIIIVPKKYILDHINPDYR